MSNTNDKFLPVSSIDNFGPPIHHPYDLEDVFDAAVALLDTSDFHEAVEAHGEIVLTCLYAALGDKLARYGVDEEKRIAIARLGRDHKFERADELFKILSCSSAR